MKNILLVILLLFIAASCNLLDKPPLDKISTEQYWKTPGDLENYTLQFYSSFPNFKNLGGWLGPIGNESNLGSDHQITTNPVTTLNGARTPVFSGGGWTWRDIRSVAIFFENYKKVNAPIASIKQYIGEAHFFLAYFYFQKVSQYGDVPWYTSSLQLNSPELFTPRMSRTAAIDSVLARLDKAIHHLAFLKDVSGGNNRLSKEAALIFKSRVGLFEGSWQKYHAGTPFGTTGADPNKYFRAAADAATELMSGKYKAGIVGTSSDDYNKLFSSTNLSSNNEVILWARYDRTLQQWAHNFQQFVTASTGGVSVTYGLIQNYLGINGRPYNFAAAAAREQGSQFLTNIVANCDPRLSQVIWAPGQVMWDNAAGKYIFVKPFLDKSGDAIATTGFQLRKGVDPKDPTAGGAQGYSTQCETGAVVFRYAEALLNYAEAKAELGEAVHYATSLNLLRKRVSMPDFAIQSDASRSQYADFGYTISDELYEIRRERAVELACENFRYDDWRRWRAHALFLGKRPKGMPLLKSEYPATKIRVDANNFIDPFAASLPTGYKFNAERDYLDCVPKNEIVLNPKLTQNPGW